MSRGFSSSSRFLLSVVALLALLSITACGSEAASGEADLDSNPADTGAVSVREPIGPATDLPPNELGEIMVLEYHRLGEPENEWRRSPENFRADLHLLYEAGYRPITVRQMVEGDIDIPRGTTPVVFTIDDSSAGQFHLLEDGSIDPNSMVGIWDNFQQENPGWEGGAVWCVLPAADHPSNFFGELPSREVPRAEREARIKRKLDYLVDAGHEICNHTLFHARLDRAPSDEKAQEWIGRGEDSIRVYLPDYRIVTLALPLGMWPKTRSLAWEGSYNGKPYRYQAVLEVTGGPSDSPFDTNFDPLSIKRVIVTPNALGRNLARYEQNPHKRYVSDGEREVITVPENGAERVDVARWSDREVRIVASEP